MWLLSKKKKKNKGFRATENERGNQTLLATFILEQSVFQIFVKNIRYHPVTKKMNKQLHTDTKCVAAICLLFLISISCFPNVLCLGQEKDKICICKHIHHAH